MTLLILPFQKLDRNAKLEDEMGKTLTALDVFAISIKFLVDDMHEVVNLRVSGVIRRDDVHWVLTVPAIWTDSAKQFMREAAEKVITILISLVNPNMMNYIIGI